MPVGIPGISSMLCPPSLPLRGVKQTGVLCCAPKGPRPMGLDLVVRCVGVGGVARRHVYAWHAGPTHEQRRGGIRKLPH